MAQIVKTDAPQIVVAQHKLERIRKRVRQQQVSHRVYADVAVVLLVVASAAQLAIFFLLLLQGEQPFPEHRHKGQGTFAGFGFGGVGFYDDLFPVQPNCCNRVTDFERVLLKVHRIPFQPHNLAAAQAVKRSQHNRHFDFVAAHRIKQGVHFFPAAKVPGKLVFLWAVYLVSGVHVNQVSFHCVFQSAMNNRMIVNYRVRFHTLQLFLIKTLDMNRFQVAQRNAETSKVGNNLTFG